VTEAVDGSCALATIESAAQHGECATGHATLACAFPSEAPLRFALPAILLAVFLMPIGISGTAVLLPRIADGLGTSPAPLQWVVNGFTFSFAIFTPVWGVASDRIGYKTAFVSGIVLVIAGSTLSAAAPTLVVLDGGRVLAGVGGAAIFTGASATISHAYGPETRSRSFALFGATLGLGGAVGPTLAGLVSSWLGWRSVFACYAMVALAALSMCAFVPEVRTARIAGSRVVDLSVLRNRHFLALSLVTVADAVGFMTVFTYLPVALSAEHGLSSSTSGTLLLLMTVPILVGPLLATRLIATVPSVTTMKVLYISLVLLVVGDLGMYLLRPDLSLAWIILPMLLLGFAWGLPAGLVDGEAIAALPPEASGTAAGVLNLMRLGSEAIAIAAYATGIGILIHSTSSSARIGNQVAAGVPGHGQLYAAAYGWVLLVVVAVAAIVALAVRFLERDRAAPRRGPRQAPPSAEPLPSHLPSHERGGSR
jgi:predicted MFS family arabinose efflux permease